MFFQMQLMWHLTYEQIFYYYWISNHSPKKYEAYHKELEKERIIANDDIFIEQNNSYNTI